MTIRFPPDFTQNPLPCSSITGCPEPRITVPPDSTKSAAPVFSKILCPSGTVSVTPDGIVNNALL